MKKFGTILAAAAVVSLGSIPAGIGSLPFGGEAHAQGQSAAGKAKGNSGVFRGGQSADMSGGRGNAARQGGLSMQRPVFRGDGAAHGDRQFGGRSFHADVSPPGAQKFRYGFCPPGLADKGCIPPGLQAFAPGDRIPEHISFDRIFHRDYGLPAPRTGEVYGRIDNDVYLISGATQQVIESINLLGRARR